MNSQISEINNKINFIMNQINKEDDESKNVANPLENNVHDIIPYYRDYAMMLPFEWIEYYWAACSVIA